jgi:hypothetical protein
LLSSLISTPAEFWLGFCEDQKNIGEKAMIRNAIEASNQEALCCSKIGYQLMMFCFFMLFTETLVAAIPDKSQAIKPLSKARHQQILSVEGRVLSELIGQSIEKIAVFSVNSEGKRNPIAFQVNEKTTEGFTYFKEANIPLNGRLGILDETDEVIFMLRDTGKKLNYKEITEKNLIELAAETEDGPRYAYVSQSQKKTVFPSKVSFNEQTGKIKSDYYELSLDKKNPINWKSFQYVSFIDKKKESILDTLKIRVKTGVFSRFTKITLDNDNLKAKLLSVKEGEITTTLLMKMQVVVANIPVMSLLLYMDAQPQQISIHSRADVPKIAKSVLVNPSMSLSLDGNNLWGSQVKTALSPDAMIVDGVLSQQEQQLAKGGISNDNNWIWFGTGRGFDLLAYMSVPKHFDAPIKLLYEDSEKMIDQPERFLGQGPNLGYRIEDFTAGKVLVFQANLVFSDSMGSLTPEKFAAQIQFPPRLRKMNTYDVASVRSVSEKN